MSALSPAPSVTSVVTPVILTLPRGEADYLPEARAGGKGHWEAARSPTWDPVTEWYLLVL